MTLRWDTDPGHAWLEVSLDEYPEAYLFATGFGYRSQSIIYLEEDCEATAFYDFHPELNPHLIGVREFSPRGFKNNVETNFMKHYMKAVMGPRAECVLLGCSYLALPGIGLQLCNQHIDSGVLRAILAWATDLDPRERY